MNSMTEKDWKLLRSIEEEKLYRACSGILQKLGKEIDFEENGEYQSYLKVWEILNSEDINICDMFDDLKRSNAILKLVLWKQNGSINRAGIK